MVITYEGRQYEFDLADVTVKQALKIERFMGCPFADWGKLLEAGGDLMARQALGWLILHPDDGTAIEDTDFKMVALGDAIEKAFADAGEGLPEEEVPTGAASTGPVQAASSPASLPPSSGATSS